MSYILKRVRRTVTKSLFMGLAAFLILGTPVPAVYVHAADTTQCSPVATPPAGTQAPTGSDATTYTYNSCTGLWENPHYTWNSVTKVRTPVPWPTYTYNATTKLWDAEQWVYSPAQSKWLQQSISVQTPPAEAPTVGGPTPPATTTTPTTTTAPTPAATTTPNTASPTSDTNGASTNATNTNSASVTTTTGASLNNTIDSGATTGNATVSSNTQGGDATSGNAQALANVANSIQSSSVLGPNTVTFVANINGDVQGDLLIDPSALQPASGSSTLSTANKLTTNTTTNAAITNNISLAAASGNAAVTTNTSAGNATTGNASAVANVVNMINSMISAQQSFIGVININGNLKGNILVPQSFIDSLLASNTPRQTVKVSNNTLNSVTTNTTTNQAITNNVSSSAQSGAATVTGNTSAGNATSGNATTNVTIFDLTSSHVMAKNTLLVFVNVTGKWFGLIMDAPAGATAAAFGGGVTANTTVANTVNATATTNQAITNNINVVAKSGDATVAQNTQAGNATSGDASTAVNLLNITSSDFSLTNWFGILFINVFGNWFGSFGVAKPVTTIPSSHTTARTPTKAQTFSFLPYQRGTTMTRQLFTTSSSSGGTGGGSHQPMTGSSGSLAANTVTDWTPAIAQVAQNVLKTSVDTLPTSHHTTTSANQSATSQSLLFGATLFAAGLALFFGERIRSLRGQR